MSSGDVLLGVAATRLMSICWKSEYRYPVLIASLGFIPFFFKQSDQSKKFEYLQSSINLQAQDSFSRSSQLGSNSKRTS